MAELRFDMDLMKWRLLGWAAVHCEWNVWEATSVSPILAMEWHF